mgnify:CR=1 FL=1
MGSGLGTPAPVQVECLAERVLWLNRHWVFQKIFLDQKSKRFMFNVLFRSLSVTSNEKHEKKPICQEFYLFHLKNGFKEHFKPLLFNTGQPFMIVWMFLMEVISRIHDIDGN